MWEEDVEGQESFLVSAGFELTTLGGGGGGGGGGLACMHSLTRRVGNRTQGWDSGSFSTRKTGV